ncbi:MAG: glucosaminidase domain-containing protein [Ktedonobacteraceae bacterium]|nr:glucosaminidase domain-containing protein [Ktedonobacteraceae bacterium]
MASGSYAEKPAPQAPSETYSPIPPRATQQLQAATHVASDGESHFSLAVAKITQVLHSFQPSSKIVGGSKRVGIVDEFTPRLLERPAFKLLIISITCAVIFFGVVLSAGIYQRPGDQQLSGGVFDGQVYAVQVGGILAEQWQSNAPLPLASNIPIHAGPYSVLGKPTITADFINSVLDSYHSPAAGKGQALYDLGVKYGVDPAFALAFFQHESTFGNYGEARSSLSLGNLRCIPNAMCRNNYAWFNTWEDGFEAWYKLIRNLYVAIWGLTTVDAIIPRYAPTSDNNNEAAYIAAVKHSIDNWRAGVITP